MNASTVSRLTPHEVLVAIAEDSGGTITSKRDGVVTYKLDGYRYLLSVDPTGNVTMQALDEGSGRHVLGNVEDFAR